MIAASTSSQAPRPRLGGTLLRTQPDRRLASLAGEGSEAAFEEIVRRYRAGLVAFAGRIASRDSADDVVQDSMVKAHAALLRGDGPESVRAWLFAIVRNTALNERRDRRVHQQLDENQDGVEQPPEAADRRRRLRDLVHAMAKLPAAQREAIVQRELEGKGHDEIARALQISPGAVRQLIFRARSALRAGAGALLPMQLLRAAILSGATDQAGSGAAATAGTAGKLGIGAIVTAGALVAGTNAVKEEATPAERQPIATQASVVRQHGVERVVTERANLPSATDRRQRVVVTPRRVSSQRTSTTPSRVPSRDPQRAGPTPGTQTGIQPAPSGQGGSGGTGGSSGAQLVGGNAGTQTSPAPSTRDCQSDGGRDLGPGGVSPG